MVERKKLTISNMERRTSRYCKKRQPLLGGLVKRKQRNVAVPRKNVGQGSLFLRSKLLTAYFYADVNDSREK